MKKNILAILVSALMVTGLSVISASAEEIEATAAPETIQTVNNEVNNDVNDDVNGEEAAETPVPESEVVLEFESFKYKKSERGVTIIEYTANEASVEVPKQIEELDVVEIGEGAFREKSVENVSLPDTIVQIDAGAFENCSSLKKINMPSALVVIYGNAFAECSSLETVVFPETLQYFGEGAFYNCTSLNYVEIPKAVNDFNGSVFGGCEKLYDISVNAENPYYVSEGNVIYSKDKTMLVAFPCSHDGVYSIPEGTLAIGYAAFYKCSGLEEIIMPSTLKTIANAAFVKCSSLTSAEIPESVTSLGGYAFSGCTSLKRVSVPRSVSELKEYTFANCSSLENVKLYSTISSIGENAFSGCTTACTIETDSDTNPAAKFAQKNGLQYKQIAEPKETDESVYTSEQYSFSSVNVIFNGEPFVTEPAARIINDRVVVPMRALFEKMNAEVSWNEEERSIDSVLGSTVINMKIDSNIMWKNGEEIMLEAPAVILEDRTMVPARAVAEAFGAEVSWDEASRTVIINYNKTEQEN